MELKSSGKIDEAYKLIQIYYFAIHPREKGEIIFELFTEEELNWHNGVIRKRYEPSDR